MYIYISWRCVYIYIYISWIIYISIYLEALVAQTVKCLPAMPETRVRSLGQEDPLEKEMAIHSITLAWKIPWTEEPGDLQSMGSQRVGHDWATSLSYTERDRPTGVDRGEAQRKILCCEMALISFLNFPKPEKVVLLLEWFQ